MADAERRRTRPRRREGGASPRRREVAGARRGRCHGRAADGREVVSTELRAEIRCSRGASPTARASPGAANPHPPRVLTTLSAGGQIVRATNDGRYHVASPLDVDALVAGRRTPPRRRRPKESPRWSSAGCARLGPGPRRTSVVGLGSTLAGWCARRWPKSCRRGRRRRADRTPARPTISSRPSGRTMGRPAVVTRSNDDGVVERDWYLGSHKLDRLHTSGTPGPTAWWDGRIVGGWSEAESGEVSVQLWRTSTRRGRWLRPKPTG